MYHVCLKMGCFEILGFLVIENQEIVGILSSILQKRLKYFHYFNEKSLYRVFEKYDE